MQLRLLYDQKIGEVPYSRLIEELELDQKVYSEYDSNKKPMCSPQQSGWKGLVDFKKGVKTVEEILNEGN